MSIINKENVRKYGLGAVASTALFAGSQANAALDVAGALADSTAEANIETGATWALGIAVVIFAARKVIGFFSR